MQPEKQAVTVISSEVTQPAEVCFSQLLSLSIKTRLYKLASNLLVYFVRNQLHSLVMTIDFFQQLLEDKSAIRKAPQNMRPEEEKRIEEEQKVGIFYGL